MNTRIQLAVGFSMRDMLIAYLVSELLERWSCNACFWPILLLP